LSGIDDKKPARSEEAAMLSYEWTEFEALCDRLAHLRSRYAGAQRSRNVGLTEALKGDIAVTKRHREQLLQHISVRLGSCS
jgi:hypothetical protein